jgi:F-type H+-transporting ATPase subunit delta
VKAERATARRYAKALHLAAREADTVEATGAEIETLAALVAGHAELREALARPWIKGPDRRAAAAAVAQRAGVSQLTRNFLALVAERGRIDHLDEMVRAYRQLVDEQMNRVRAQVRTTTPLEEPAARQLAARLERTLGKQVVLEQTVDPALLGGFVAQVGSLIIDGSLDGQLERMRERLARG